MRKGKKRSKKKVIPKRPGSEGPAPVVRTPPLPAGEPTGTAKEAPVADRECINCDNCGIANPQKCCSQCLCAYYCSRKCQLENWKLHKQSCTFLKRARGHYNAARDRNNLPGGPAAAIDESCAVCLEEEVEHPVTFECGHTFCFGCIYAYQCKEEHSSCPYCRSEIPNVGEEAGERYNLYIRRAEAAQEGSEERKMYCQLAMAEYDAAQKAFDAASQTSKHPRSFLYFKAQIISILKDPEALLKVTGEILSGIQSRCLNLDHAKFIQTKLWRAQAYSKMENWIKASEICSELRTEDQLGNFWNEFLLEMEHCRCLFELGDYHKAVECGHRAVNIRRHRAGVHEYLARAQKAIGDTDSAKKTMSRAILHEPQWNFENLKRNKQILREL